jgi:hypothetical protein
MQTIFPEIVYSLLGYLNETGKTYWQRLRSIAEVDRLDIQERSRIANDLGISSSELRALTFRDKKSADLLIRRMGAIGLDPRGTDGAVMRDLRRCCSMCKDKVLCLHELEDKPRRVTWPIYCPNELTLRALSDENKMRSTATNQAQWPNIKSTGAYKE